MEFDIVTGFLMMMFAFALGDFISTKTNAMVPSLFVAAVVFLIGFWTFWPENIGEISGFSAETTRLATYLILVNMGTSISIKQLLSSWKTVVLSLFAMAGLTIFIIVIGRPIIGREATLVASPVLAGGIMAALEMQRAALAKGLADLGTLAILVLVAQGFVGYPLTALALRKEGEMLLENYRKLSPEERNKTLNLAVDGEKNLEKNLSRERSIVPEKFRSDNTYLFQAAILAFIAVKISNLTNAFIPATIACLLAGIIGTEIGFVDTQPVRKASSMGFIMLANLILALGGLNSATLEMVKGLVIPLLIVIVAGVIGLGIFSAILGKRFGFSKAYSIALGLNCLLGFPPNMIITNDVSKALADNKEEEEYLNDTMLPDMLIAGFTTVTIGSVILAGIFAKML